MLLSCNLFILLPSALYGMGGFIIIKAIDSFVMFRIIWVWLGINVVYGLLFSIPAMIIISISTLIIIEKELTKGNMILFIWLIFCPFWFLIITDTVSYGAFLLMPVIVMVIICINTLIIIKKEHKKGNIIKQNLFIWLTLWLLNAIAILSNFGIAMIVARQ